MLVFLLQIPAYICTISSNYPRECVRFTWKRDLRDKDWAASPFKRGKWSNGKKTRLKMWSCALNKLKKRVIFTEHDQSLLKASQSQIRRYLCSPKLQVPRAITENPKISYTLKIMNKPQNLIAPNYKLLIGLKFKPHTIDHDGNARRRAEGFV